MEDERSSVDELLDRYKYPLAVGLVGMVLLIGGVLSSGILPKTFLKNAALGEKNSAQIKVDVSGAVANPGVYTLPLGSRMEEALKAAGGVTGNADPIFLTKVLNLAQKVSDGSKIYVPIESLGDQEGAPGSSQSVAGVSAESSQSMVNINTASADELDKLPGIGVVTAQKIIDSRPYGSLDELLSRKIISKAVFDKIKDRLSVY